MKSYTFQVQLERDAERWRAFYPLWENEGASTWGSTEEETLRHMQDVLFMMVTERNDEGRPPGKELCVIVPDGWVVTVTM